MNADLVIALDFPTVELAEKCMQDLEGLPVVYKVGLELFLVAGPRWVRNLCANGTRVFLDLKFHDIPNTVGQSVVQAAGLGVEFLTLHLSGGKRMLDEVAIRLKETAISGDLKKAPRILGVSVLTSFKEEDWIANVSHFARVTSVRTIEESVMHFANLANGHEAVSGMVCSPKEVQQIRSKYPNLYLMVPGIRPEGSPLNDQQRVMTPDAAIKAGASAIVVGRPITQSPNPRQVAEAILKDLK